MFTVSISSSIVRSRFIEASALQRMLPHLVAVELAARQARWNVSGPEATAMRDILASVVADMADLTERVAERLIERGFTPDVRPSEIMATAVRTRAGRLSQEETAMTMVVALSAASSPVFDAVVAVESSGSAGHDISRAALAALRSYGAQLAASAAG